MVNLVTGATGFIGTYLVKHLREKFPNDVTHALSRTGETKCDLTDEKAVTKVLSEIKPDRIYHLAGISRIREALPAHFEQGYLTLSGMVRAIKPLNKKVSLFLASSAHVYGNQEGMISETVLPRPISSYGFCKYITEELARHANLENPNLSVVVGRLYSCIGPGQGDGFVVSDLAQRLAQVGKEKGKLLKTGALTGHRQFIDVRDLVEILPKLLSLPNTKNFELVNIASKDSWKIKDVVDLMVAESGLKLSVESSPDLAPNPFLGLKLDTEKLESLVHPRYRPLPESIRDILTEKRS